MISIVTDSSCDLPDELVEKYGITLVPLKITIDKVEYTEIVDITAEEFAEKMLASDSLPKTSQPSPEDFNRVFTKLTSEKDGVGNGKHNQVLCLTISSGLSGTYQSACLGKDLTGKDEDIIVFDTLAGSLGHGLQVIKAAELAEEGFSMEEIVDELKRYREEMNIFILLDTLENIVKGGRLSRFKGSVAEILNLKILLEGVDGKVEMLKKVRGKKKFLKKFLDLLGERRTDFSDTVFGITHINNYEDAEFLKQEIIKRYSPKDVIINNMGGTMGTYAGDGGIIVSF